MLIIHFRRFDKYISFNYERQSNCSFLSPSFKLDKFNIRLNTVEHMFQITNCLHTLFGIYLTEIIPIEGVIHDVWWLKYKAFSNVSIQGQCNWVYDLKHVSESLLLNINIAFREKINTLNNAKDFILIICIILCIFVYIICYT